MEIKVEKVYTKDITWEGCKKCKKKVCNCGAGKQEWNSQAVTVASEGNYYSVKGWGATRVKEGDTIKGEVTTETYNANGETKEKNVITLAKPDFVTKPEFDAFVEMVEERLGRLENVEKQDEEIDTENIPF